MELLRGPVVSLVEQTQPDALVWMVGRVSPLTQAPARPKPTQLEQTEIVGCSCVPPSIASSLSLMPVLLGIPLNRRHRLSARLRVYLFLPSVSRRKTEH